MAEIDISIGMKRPDTVAILAANRLQYMSIGHHQVPVYEKSCSHMFLAYIDPTGAFDGPFQALAATYYASLPLSHRTAFQVNLSVLYQKRWTGSIGFHDY